MSPSNDVRMSLGRKAEQLVAEYLARAGVALIANARQGRLEIDLIARRDRLVVFCEVRSHSDARFISPAHTITRVKAIPGASSRSHVAPVCSAPRRRCAI